MNRRSFFSFLAAAPLAAFAAVKGLASIEPEGNVHWIARIMKQAREIIDGSPTLQSYVDDRLKRASETAERVSLFSGKNYPLSPGDWSKLVS